MEYFLHDGKEQTGPFNLEYLNKIVEKKSYHVWYEGETIWKPLIALFPHDNHTTIEINDKDDIGITSREVNKKSGSSDLLLIILSICIIIITGLVISMFWKNSDLKEQVDFINNEKETLDRRLNKIYSSYYPIVINGLTFQNGIEKDFVIAKKFKSIESKYIYPIISFQKLYPPIYPEETTILDTGRVSITIGVKIIDSKGKLQCMHSSSDVFTFSQQLDLPDLQSNNLESSNSVTLQGWGSKISPSYLPGKYYVQIWYENKCLYEGSFEIV